MAVSTKTARNGTLPLLEVRDLRTYFFTKYGTVRAVDGVSFSLKPGEVLGLVGESGSGKSVTATSILRLIQPPGRILSGEILFEGENLLTLSESEMRDHRGQDITMILQDPLTSLNPVFQIGNQVGEPLQQHQGVSGQTLVDKVVSLLQRVRIPDAGARAAHYPHQFSGGMRQRVMASIAVACSPKLLIADEPTTALDVTIQAQFLTLLRELKDEFNLAVLYITHDLAVVAQICDRVAVMYAGHIVEVGDVRRLFESPAHPYTEGLIKSVPRLGRKSDRLYSIDGQPPDLSKAVAGCPFAPRCPYTMPICLAQPPPAFETSDGGFANCWKLA